MFRKMHAQLGLTLIELMITIAIAAILLLIAAPQFSELIRRNELRSEAEKFRSALAYARSMAISENVAVSICGRPVGADVCVNDLATSWPGGWLIYTNETEDGQLCATLRDCVLRKYDETVSQLEIVSVSGWLGFNDRGERIDAGATELALCGGGSRDNLTTFSIGASGNIRLSSETATCP